MAPNYDRVKHRLNDLLQDETDEHIVVGAGETVDDAYQDILEDAPDYAADELQAKYGDTLEDHEFSFEDDMPRVGRPIKHVDADIDLDDVHVLAAQYGPEAEDEVEANENDTSDERRSRGGGSDGSSNEPRKTPRTDFFDA